MFCTPIAAIYQRQFEAIYSEYESFVKYNVIAFYNFREEHISMNKILLVI